VIHRDIKPANIFLARRGDGSVHAKILDFGIAKMTDRPAAGFQTEAGSVLGTPYYLAPERATGQALDPRADLYSLGVILYELLTGNVPFVADSFVEILGKHVRQHALDPRQAAPERPIPDRIARLTMRLLAKDPADRPENAGVLAVELGRIAREDAASLRAVATGPRLSAGEAGTSTRVLVEVAARSTSAGVGPGPMTSFAGGVVPAAPATEPGDSRPDAAETEDADLPDGPRRRGPTAAVFLLIVFGVLGAAAGLAYLELRGPAQAARAPAEPAALESPGIPASSASTIAEPAPGVAGRAEPESPAPGPNSSAPGEPEPGPEAPRPARPRREKPRKAPREPTPADKPTESSTAATGPTIKDDVYEE
jgi:serine/threonine-protein kinase